MIRPPGRKEYFDVCHKRKNPFSSRRNPGSGDKSTAFRDWLDGRSSAIGCAAGDEPDARTRERRGLPVCRPEPGSQCTGIAAYAGGASHAAGAAGIPQNIHDEPGHADQAIGSAFPTGSEPADQPGALDESAYAEIDGSER